MVTTTPAVRARFWPWPGLIFVLLGMSVALDLTFLGVALGRDQDLVAGDPYAAGLAWDDERAARARGAALEWNLTLEPRDTSRDEYQIVCALATKTGEPVAAPRVSATLVQGAHLADAVETELVRDADGRYVGRARLPHAGQWELDLRVELAGQACRHRLVRWIDRR